MNRRKFIGMLGSAVAIGFVGKTAVDAIASNGNKSKIRWAMAVDLKKCAENNVFQKCIDACHDYHNVPEIPNKMHEIKWIWKEDYRRAFIEQENEHLPKDYAERSVLLFCNHCDNPPCTHVCPTEATWKREEDGIVMMDWHRCIGCRYCVAACPYGSRSFNWIEPRKYLGKINIEFPTRTKGVVEKCTFCAELISHGKMPKCVEVCDDMELVFGNLNDKNSEINSVLRERYSIRRKPELGTQPEVYYLI